MKQRYPHTIENGAGEWLTFERRMTGMTGERVEGSNRVATGQGPPMHVHYQQDEGLTVVQGRMGYQCPDDAPAVDSAAVRSS